ncbi:hypothetical protein ACLOAV_008932 [Pseudogymnoascus australis]
MPPPRLIPRPLPSHPQKPNTTAPTTAPPKIHKTVSTAAILKRKPMAALHAHSYRAPHRRRREKGMHPLLKDYQGIYFPILPSGLFYYFQPSDLGFGFGVWNDIARCLASAEAKATSSLSTAHAALQARVDTVKDANAGTLSTLQTQYLALLAPLDDNDPETTTTATAITATTGTGIAQQIEIFRADLLRGERELERLWRVWGEAQGEIEGMGEGGGDVRKGWERVVRERIGEMEGEVMEAGREAVRGLGEMEKEIDRKLREDQAKLVAMMFGEE